MIVNFKLKMLGFLVTAAVLVVIALLVYLTKDELLNKGADSTVPTDTINVSGTVSYNDAEGVSHSAQSGNAQVAKVNIPTVDVDIRGRSNGQVAATYEIREQGVVSPVGNLNLTTNAQGASPMDWTGISQIDLAKGYDLWIKVPGFLPRRVLDINLNLAGTVSAGTVYAGDINGDGSINSTDYIVWKEHLGQSVPAGTLGDFNGDGRVSGADFSISFGSKCYRATVETQDRQCNL